MTLTRIILENLDSARYLNIAPLFAQATCNTSDGYIPGYTRIIHTNLQTAINKQ